MDRTRLSRSRRPASAEAGLVLLLLLVPLSVACSGAREAEPDPDQELARFLGLVPGAEVHRVNLGGWGVEEHAVPTVVRAMPGDAVIFETVDHRVHTVSFTSDSLASSVREFLIEHSSLSSPPLVTRGSTFVLYLEGAPPGRYPFLSEGHGGRAPGVIIVGEPEADSLAGGR